MARHKEPWNPNTADWMVKQRGERTQDDVVAAMRGRGVAVKRAWLSRIENGARFSATLLESFADFYGSVPPAYEPAADPPDSSLAAAIRELTGELRAAREERQSTEARLRAVEGELRSLRARPADEASPEQSAPHETAVSER